MQETVHRRKKEGKWKQQKKGKRTLGMTEKTDKGMKTGRIRKENKKGRKEETKEQKKGTLGIKVGM